MNGFERYTKKTRRQVFLEEMEQVVPWRELCGLIEPHYPKPGNGRPPVGVERMLRIYFLQQWFNLSDPGVEEALYDAHQSRPNAGVAFWGQDRERESVGSNGWSNLRHFGSLLVQEICDRCTH